MLIPSPPAPRLPIAWSSRAVCRIRTASSGLGPGARRPRSFSAALGPSASIACRRSGHKSDKMARHYAGEARNHAAADLMERHSLAS